MLHVSRPVRWDSDHVVILDDELREIAHELRGRRVYVDQSVREDFGDDWDAARKFF